MEAVTLGGIIILGYCIALVIGENRVEKDRAKRRQS